MYRVRGKTTMNEKKHQGEQKNAGFPCLIFVLFLTHGTAASRHWKQQYIDKKY